MTGGMKNPGLFTTVGKCIYCGSTGPDLTDEHAVPLGLLPREEPGIVLKEASCPRCAVITSRFESVILRKLWRPIRAGLNLRSYRKSAVPREYPLQIERNGKSEVVTLPLEEFPAVAMFPTFKLPGCISGDHIENGIGVNGNWTIQLCGPPAMEVAAKLGATKISITHTFDGMAYEILLCKVAYCYAVTQVGAEQITENFIAAVILGQSPQVGEWLGFDGKELLDKNPFHSVGVIVQQGSYIPEYVSLQSIMLLNITWS
jgi:hypothetical protein